MTINLFLWPMLIPMLIPIFYCIFYKKKSIVDVLVITFTMILIVVLYWPLSLEFWADANLYVKILLFIKSRNLIKKFPG